MIKVLPYGKYFTLEQDGAVLLDVISGPFPTIQALENHIKLMLIAVQSYKKLSQPVQQDDWTFEDDCLYKNFLRIKHE